MGIVGTGASGIQAIPVIAAQADHLTVFQRTAQFTIPAANGPLSEDLAAMWKENYEEWRRRGRFSRGGVPYPATDRTALEMTAEERREAYEAAWEQGGFVFALGTFADLLVDEDANETAAEFVRSKIDEIVHDPPGRRDAEAPGVPLRHQAPPAGHRLLRDVQPAERHARRHQADSHRADHPDRGADHGRLPRA